MAQNQSFPIIELDYFEPAHPILPAQKDTFARKYLTLLRAPENGLFRGGTGSVLKVLNAESDVISLKCLLPLGNQLSTQEKETVFRARVQAFAEEYKTHRRILDVPGIPDLFGYGSIGGGPVILMEWIAGAPIGSLIKYFDSSNTLGWPALKAAGLAISVLTTLIQAHEKSADFVHRDISAGNIMIRTDRFTLESQLAVGSFDTCLIDFGSSIAERGDESTFLTQMNGIWRNATPEYAPPEMLTYDISNIHELRENPCIDTYALCGILYHLYSGRTPYQLAERKHQSPYRLKIDYAPPKLEPKFNIDTPFVNTIMSGLAPLPESRPTAQELFDCICAWLKTQGEAGAAIAQIPAIHKNGAHKIHRGSIMQIKPLQIAHGGARITEKLPIFP